MIMSSAQPLQIADASEPNAPCTSPAPDENLTLATIAQNLHQVGLLTENFYQALLRDIASGQVPDRASLLERMRQDA